MRVHWPLTSFIGYFRRRSPETSSRTEAPLAQCEPRLIGLSQAGSWPIQTSLATSAWTVQPTEQWVQTLLRTMTSAPAGGGGPALALRTEPSGSAPSVATLPAARPERRRKARRSRPSSVSFGKAPMTMPRRVCRCVRLMSTAASSLRWITIHAVIGLNVLRVRLVTRLALLIVRLAVGHRFLQERPGRNDRDASTAPQGTEKVAPSNPLFRLHCAHSLNRCPG